MAVAIFNISAAALCVSLESPNPTPPFTNWLTAARVIQDAVDAAKAGDTVLVTNGVYAVGQREILVPSTNWLRGSWGLNRVVITNSITLQSLNGPLSAHPERWEAFGPVRVSATVSPDFPQQEVTVEHTTKPKTITHETFENTPAERHGRTGSHRRLRGG
jgi:hypothetical protein